MEGKIDAPKRFSVRSQHVRIRVLVKKKAKKLANHHFEPCSHFILLELINEEVVSTSARLVKECLHQTLDSL